MQIESACSSGVFLEIEGLESRMLTGLAARQVSNSNSQRPETLCPVSKLPVELWSVSSSRKGLGRRTRFFGMTQVFYSVYISPDAFPLNLTCSRRGKGPNKRC